MTRTGIYGGSFNPIHAAHLSLARSLINQGMLDELWYVVSPQNPFKQAATDLLPDEVRLHLTRLAVADEPGIKVSDVEMHLPRPSYMANTLAVLREKHPDREFILVIGADNWLAFERWYHWQEILARHSVIVYPRPGYPIDAATLPPNVTLADTPLMDISSTDIRKRIRSSAYDGRDLKPAVWQEINRKGYYK